MSDPPLTIPPAVAPRTAHPLPAAPSFLPALPSRAAASSPTATLTGGNTAVGLGNGVLGMNGTGSGSGGGGAINPLFIKPRPGFENAFVPRNVEDWDQYGSRRSDVVGGRNGGSKRRHSPSPNYRDRERERAGPSRDMDRGYDRERDREHDRDRARDRDRDGRDRHEPRPRLSTSTIERERPGFIRERSPPPGSAAGTKVSGLLGTTGQRPRSRSRSLPGDSNGPSERRDVDPDGGRGEAGERRWDPEEKEEVLSYRDYVAWAREWDQELIDKEDKAVPVPGRRRPLSVAYHEYRQRYSSRQLWALFLAHRDEAWFKEKYMDEPVLARLREQVWRNGKVPAIKRFMSELEKGSYQGVNYDAEPTPSTCGPESLDGDGLAHVAPGKNQVFIKAIPVGCDRADLQAILGRVGQVEYIAIGDPIQKKGFSRAGWAAYVEGTNIQQVVRELKDASFGNLPLHITENTVDHLNRVRVTPGVCSTVARYEVDIAQAKALVLALEAPLFATKVPTEEMPAVQLFGEVAPPPVLDVETVKLLDAAVEGVLRERGLIKEDLTEDERKERLRIELDHWMLYLRQGLHTCYYCVSNNDHAEELYRKCIRHVRAPATEASVQAAGPIPAAHPDIFGGSDEDKEDLAAIEAEEKDDVGADMDMDLDREREMDRHQYGRKGAGGAGTSPAEIRKIATSERRWAQWVDKKLRVITHPDEIIPSEYYGRDLETEKAKISRPLIKREEENKYRCRRCAKLFKAPEYLYKHIPTKHAELFVDVVKDTRYFNAFCLDPQHLIPHRHQPASVNDRLPSKGLLPPQTIDPARSANVNGGGGRVNGRGGAGGGRDGHGAGRREGGSGAGLLGRVGGYANDAPPRRNRQGNTNGTESRQRPNAPPNTGPPDERLLAPPKVADDPRAGRGRVNYRDLDAPQAVVPDDGGLPY